MSTHAQMSRHYRLFNHFESHSSWGETRPKNISNCFSQRASQRIRCMSYFCCAISLSIFHTTQNCCCYLRLSQAKWPCFTQPSPIWNHTLRTSRVGFMSSNLNLIASLRKERQTSNFYPKKTTLRLQQCGHTHLAFQCNQHLRQGFFWNLPKSFEKIPSDGAMFFSPVATPETQRVMLRPQQAGSSGSKRHSSTTCES